MDQNPFEAFHKKQSSYTANAHSTSIYFVIGKDDNGAFLSIQDSKGKVIDMPNHHLFSGVDREIVRQYAQLQEKALFNINWEQPSDYIYLHEHPYLLHLLKRSSQLRIENALTKPVTFAERVVNVSLQITPLSEEKNSRYECQWKVDGKVQPFTVLTDNFLLIADLIVEVHPLGDNARLLSVFNTTVHLEDLGALLSLLYSYINNVGIDIEGWEWQRAAEPLEANPSIIFEKIDIDQSLYMRVANTLPFLPLIFRR